MSVQSHSGGSRRWKYFHSALELAIQRSAHKWNFEDFKECFPQYVEEDKDGAIQTFNQVADYIETETKKDLEKLFQDYDLQNNIDILDKIVTEAKARKASGNLGPDVWKENLSPQSTVRGRTIPILHAQVKRLRDSVTMLEAENERLISELEDEIKDIDGQGDRTQRTLDKVDETQKVWSKFPLDKIQKWTAEVAETSTPTLRS
ncbi:hypothetical protein C8R43DRAFT_431743 [Mycena crocata]|nr:hypothetical protein C8R43DRAFT_431743 [Mycena crocata]